MPAFKVFISSVQKEFAAEREALFQHFKTDALLSQFFVPILFEKLPAATPAPNRVYIEEVGQSQIYLGLLGAEYGHEDASGVSPTEQEYNHATSLQFERWIFIKGGNKLKRHPKEETFIRKVGEDGSKLRVEHASYPTNPLLAECLYQAGYIERFGTGTLEIIRLSEEAHLNDPDFNIDEGFKVVLWRPLASTGKYRASTDQVPTK